MTGMGTKSDINETSGILNKWPSPDPVKYVDAK